MRWKLAWCGGLLWIAGGEFALGQWVRHSVEAGSLEMRGADGVRLGDFDGDGLVDIASGWEESGVVRVYRNPGMEAAKSAWPAVTVGRVQSPEDAVLADVDGDGALDVVSCTEGESKAVFVHWSPGKGKLMDAGAWKTDVFPAAGGRAWMFCLPMELDGKPGAELVVGAKGSRAIVGVLRGEGRDLSKWKLERLVDTGWVMSLRAHDMNGDGRKDVLGSDRRGQKRGVFWIEQGEGGVFGAVHRLGAVGKGEPMFLDVAAGRIALATKGGVVQVFDRGEAGWEAGEAVPCPYRKGVLLADLDGDGVDELAVSGEPDYPGVAVLKKEGDARRTIDVSGPKGKKFDRLEAIDLDGDGDLDLLTCEERENLGVIWYENPGKLGE